MAQAPHSIPPSIFPGAGGSHLWGAVTSWAQATEPTSQVGGGLLGSSTPLHPAMYISRCHTPLANAHAHRNTCQVPYPPPVSSCPTITRLLSCHDTSWLKHLTPPHHVPSQVPAGRGAPSWAQAPTPPRRVSSQLPYTTLANAHAHRNTRQVPYPPPVSSCPIISRLLSCYDTS